MAALEKNIARIRLLAVLCESMSYLILTMGREEKKSGEINFFKKFSSDIMAIINDFSESITAEELGVLMRLIVRLTNHTSTLQKLFELTPEAKISIGEDLKDLSKQINLLVERIETRARK